MNPFAPPPLLGDIERARAQRAATALLVGQRLEGILYGPPERLVFGAVGLDGALSAELDPGAWMADGPTFAAWSLAHAGGIVAEATVSAAGVLSLRVGASAIHCDPDTPWRLRTVARSLAQESILAVSREGLELRLPRGAAPARSWNPTRTR